MPSHLGPRIKRRLSRPGSLDGPTVERAGGPAGYGMGVAWTGGPLYADRYGAKKGPTPWQLIEAHKQIGFACGEFNALGTAQLGLRLYMASGRGEKPGRQSKARAVRQREFERLRTLPYVERTFGSSVEDIHEITDHLILRTLKNPAEDPETGLRYFDRCSFVATHIRYIDTVGLSYIKPEDPNGAGFRDLVAGGIPPTHLWPLQAQYVWPVRMPDSALIKKFKYFLQEYDPGDLCFIRMRPSLRDPYGAGYAAAQAAWQYLGLEDSSISMWDQLLGTGARPNVIFSAKDANLSPGEDEARRLEAELNTFHARGRAGRSLVLRDAYDVTPIHYPGFDLAELEVNNYQVERIANCYGVPVSYLTRETNLANFQAGRTFHAIFGIEPRAQCLASALTDLVQRYDERLFFAFDTAIPEDEELRAKLEDMGLKNGRYTINQVNVDSPWPPVDYGDEAWIPGTWVQPSMAVEKHESGLKAAEAKANAPAGPGKPPNGGERSGGHGGGPGLPGPGPGVGHNSPEAERELIARTAALIDRIERDYDR